MSLVCQSGDVVLVAEWRWLECVLDPEMPEELALPLCVERLCHHFSPFSI